MTRDDARNYLVGEFNSLAVELGVQQTDDATGWGNAIDAALRALGVTSASLTNAAVIDGLEHEFILLLNYFGIRRLMRVAASRVTIEVGTPRQMKQREQLFAMLSTMSKEAATELANIGLSPSQRQVNAGRYGLDFLEPNPYNFY